MQRSSDLILILEPELESNGMLCEIAGRLGCEHIEADSVESLSRALEMREPTIAILAVDHVDTNFLAVLDAWDGHTTRPSVLLVGNISARVLSSAKRAAESRYMPVIGSYARPLDAIAIENCLAPRLAIAPPIQRMELERAIANYELVLDYQPKFCIGPGPLKIQGVEALIRWRHPRRGLLQPRHFLKAVEDYGLMASMTDFVMTEAVRQAASWRAAGLQLEVGINLSTRLVHDRAFPERLNALLHEHDFPADQLTLDVVESQSVEDQGLLLDVFTRLRMLGVGLALDNFGTGHSSLTELYRMPFSEIKVDRSLISDMVRERDARVIVKAFVDLAHALRLTVCAEGVESRAVLDQCRGAGFDTAQGRFFSDPVAAAEIEGLVRSWPADGPASTGSWRMTKPLDFDGSLTTVRTRRFRRQEGRGT